MQVLAAQYPTLYTYKFRVSYTDFQADADAFNAFLIKTLGKTIEVASTKIWLRSGFTGTGLTSAVLRLRQFNSLPTSDSTNGQFWQIRVDSSSGDDIGIHAFAPQRSVAGAAPQAFWISNQSTPTDLYLTLQLNAAAVINNLTSGEFDIWITVYKLP